MIRMIDGEFEKNSSIAKVTFEYDFKTDGELFKKVMQFISDNQPVCCNCKNYYNEVGFCGYSAAFCKIYGCLEEPSNPHYDGDGSRCDNYVRI